MTVKIRFLNRRGDEALHLSVEEAQNLVDAEQGRYFVVDTVTRKIMHEVKVADGQSLVLMPVIRGG